jgi:hypothetical protein
MIALGLLGRLQRLTTADFWLTFGLHCSGGGI